MPQEPEDADLLLAILQDNLPEAPERPSEAPGMAEAQERWNTLTVPTPPYRDILWAYDHLEADSVSPLDCPTRGAWALLQFGRNNQKDFLTRLLPQATTEMERRRQEDITRRREKEAEERAEKAAKRLLEQPPLPEKEAQAIADIQRLLTIAVKEAVDGKV